VKRAHGLQRRLVLLALLLLSMSACQMTKGGADSPRLDRVLERGELRVGLSGSQPPLNMTDKGGAVVGFEVDVVEALAGSMGLKIRYVRAPFAELLPLLERDEVDLVISGMTITPERNARVAFAGPYFISGKSLLTRSRKIAEEGPRGLNQPGRKYAALAGSTSEHFVKTVLPKATVVTTADYDAAVEKVIDGEVDGLVADSQVCNLSVWRNPGAKLSTSTTPFTAEPLGIALPADDPLLVNLVENYLETLEDTGLLSQYKARWLAGGDWVSELP